MSTVNGVPQNPIAPRNPLSLQGPAPAQQGGGQKPPTTGDGSKISPEAKKKPVDGERKDLLDGLKKTYGGNDRLQTAEAKLNDLSTDQLKSVKKKREFDKALTEHEEAHHSVAADLARSGPLYETEVGEDGEQPNTEMHMHHDAATPQRHRRQATAAGDRRSCSSDQIERTAQKMSTSISVLLFVPKRVTTRDASECKQALSQSSSLCSTLEARLLF